MLRTSKASFSSSDASSGGEPNASLMTRHAGSADSGLPVVDMMIASDATRCGWVAARICAIMPPSEAPTTCALVMSRWSSSATTSSVMSTRV